MILFGLVLLSACSGGEEFGGYYDFLRNTGQEKVEMFVLKNPSDGFADEQTIEKQEVVMDDFDENGVFIAKAAPPPPLQEIAAAPAEEPVAEPEPEPNLEFVCCSVCCPKDEVVCYAFSDYPCGAEC